ncbi:MAG: D-amino acid dehydrogenase [Acetobacter papayae]
MKVIILGAGVIGVTSAWYLTRLGHDVTVIDRQPEAASETSSAGTGQIVPGCAFPWARPGLPLQAVRWLLSPQDSPLRLRKWPDPAMLRWLGLFMSNCTARAYTLNAARMRRVAEYSLHCLDTLRHETGITFDDQQEGLIRVFRTHKQMELARRAAHLLSEAGIEHKFMTVEGVLEHEPGLTHAAPLLVGGMRLAHEQSGDASLFTRRLARMAEAAGARFLYNTTIQGLDASAERILSVRTSEGHLSADSYLLAMGSYSPGLLRGLNIRLPVYPIKAYSLSLPLTDESHAPVSMVEDGARNVTITRLGRHIRLSGSADLGGYTLKSSPRHRTAMELCFSELFGGGDLAGATSWTGLSPCTPDSTPIIGRADPFSNLWLNTGHGMLGWTMACGAARVVADQISGLPPEIPALDLSLRRYQPH